MKINIDIKNVKHQKINGEDTNHLKATLDGVEVSIPKDPNNRHYAEILEQVKAGTLTIADAD